MKLWILLGIMAFMAFVVPVHAETDPTITECGQITAAGYYTVTNHIIKDDNTVCLDVRADNVTIDGQWFNISGSPGIIIGDNVNERTNITIMNVNLNYTSGTYGISAYKTTFLFISNNNITASYGITLSSINNSIINASNITATGAGIWLQVNSSFNNFSSNKIKANSGILFNSNLPKDN